MPYVITEDCVKCKLTDCVETCPVDCFYEGENMLVIAPDECIDCAACESFCPIDAIVSDADPASAKWQAINRRYSAVWPRITQKKTPPLDAESWKGVPNKFDKHFSPHPPFREEGTAPQSEVIG
jgi:ferredoxin